MPTTTKKPARKTASKAPVKRAPAKVAHKTTVRRATKTKKPEMRSFRASRQQEPFFTFRISHQTLYWLILAIIVVGLGAWVTSISIRVQHIYDQIDQTNSEIMSMPTPATSSTKTSTTPAQ